MKLLEILNMNIKRIRNRFFDKKTGLRASVNEELAQKLRKLVIK